MAADRRPGFSLKMGHSRATNRYDRHQQKQWTVPQPTKVVEICEGRSQPRSVRFEMDVRPRRCLGAPRFIHCVCNVRCNPPRLILAEQFGCTFSHCLGPSRHCRLHPRWVLGWQWIVFGRLCWGRRNGSRPRRPCRKSIRRSWRHARSGIRISDWIAGNPYSR